MGKLEPQKHGGALYRPDKGETPNPNGLPKGTLHMSTHIQNLLNDELFVPENVKADGFVGTPMKAIIITAIKKAIDGDQKWADWLAKNGYGTKYVHEFENNVPFDDLDDAEKAKFATIMDNGQDQSASQSGGGAESEDAT